MENASKALIMAAEILVGLILLTIMVFGFISLKNFSDSINTNLENININEFNAKFTIYNGKTELTIHDIVSIVNLVNEYNQINDNETYQIKITGNAVKNINDIIINNTKFIEDNANKKYTVTNIEYSDKTKLVKTINIMETK